ncbi:MAG: alpha/beta hydrolase [Dehalococcoidia bacterium]|nr:alpha/beta hydrolase [Dehalococcoidia bacterium]
MPSLRRDGVSLYYEEAGAGSPVLLFVHGVCCDHTFLAPQFEHFRRTHHVISVDLRGHGSSDKLSQPYSIPGFADDVIWLVRQLGIQKPVVIGHSMGGQITLDSPCATRMCRPP